jgi:hypothetical protein
VGIGGGAYDGAAIRFESVTEEVGDVTVTVLPDVLSSPSTSSSSSSKFSSISCVSTGLGIGAMTGTGREEGTGTEGGLGAEWVVCADAPEGSNGARRAAALDSFKCIGDTTLNPSSLLSLPLPFTCVYALDDSTSTPCAPDGKKWRNSNVRKRGR